MKQLALHKHVKLMWTTGYVGKRGNENTNLAKEGMWKESVGPELIIIGVYYWYVRRMSSRKSFAEEGLRQSEGFIVEPILNPPNHCWAKKGTQRD